VFLFLKYIAFVLGCRNIWSGLNLQLVLAPAPEDSFCYSLAPSWEANGMGCARAGEISPRPDAKVWRMKQEITFLFLK
jgi:hypothetical protein